MDTTWLEASARSARAAQSQVGPFVAGRAGRDACGYDLARGGRGRPDYPIVVR